MKVLKRISLFFIYSVIIAGIGFVCGTLCIGYFYPGEKKQVQITEENHSEIVEKEQSTQEEQQFADSNLNTETQAEKEQLVSEKQDTDSLENAITRTEKPGTATARAERAKSSDAIENDVVQDISVLEKQDTLTETEDNAEPVSAFMEKLNADTDYVLQEVDVRNQTVVETIWTLPAMYIGMDREQFLAAMDLYEAAPPLAELERGFVSLEVLSFSAQRVIVQMNYEYTQPSNSFYIKAENNLLVVYLDDQQTVYMYTSIFLDRLPERVQQDIINIMFIPDEESLYNFLENYSS